MKYAFAAVSVIMFLIFVRTAPPTIYPGDSGEIGAAAYTLGIGHPPGYPLLTMAEKIISLVPAGDIAFRMNLLPAIITPLFMIIFVFLVSYAAKIISKEAFRPWHKIVVMSAVCAFIFSGLFWFETVHIKGGVYIIEYFLICAAFYFALKYYAEKQDRHFYASVYIAGFLPSAHHTAVLAMIFILVWLFILSRGKKPRFYTAAAAFFALSFFTPYLYLYIRAQAAAVRWADIAAPYEIIRHIFRSVYFDSASPPFTINALIFKIWVYVKSAALGYHIMLVPAVFGAYRLWKEQRKVFKWLIIFFGMNFFGTAFFTSNDPSLLYVDTNAVFYLLNDLVLFMSAAYGLSAAISLTRNFKAGIALCAITLLLPCIFVFLNYKSSDLSRTFIAYDNAENIARTIEPDGIFFEKSDETVFALQYMAVVKNKYKNLSLYDSNGNVLDFSYLRKIRNKGGFTREAQRALELEAAYKHPAKVFYQEGIGFPEKQMLNKPYGMLYVLMDENIELKNAGNLMQLYSIRDFFSNKHAGLTCRDMIARYMTAAALHAARERNVPRFKFYESAALWKAGDYANVYKSIASIYYHVFADGKNCLHNLETSVSLEPYDFGVINLIIEIYKELNMPDMAVKWYEYYYKKEWNFVRKQEIKLQIDYLKRAKLR